MLFSSDQMLKISPIRSLFVVNTCGKTVSLLGFLGVIILACTKPIDEQKNLKPLG
jgi:hypothetical protein